MRIPTILSETDPSEDFSEEPGIDSGLPDEADSELSYLFAESDLISIADRPEIRRLIEGAMNGTIPLLHPLEVNQPAKLSPRAIQAIMLAVGNYYTTREIASITGMNYVYLTKLLRHPYARQILSACGAVALENLNCLDRRLKRQAPKMMKVLEDIVEDPDASLALKSRVAFGWLEQLSKSRAREPEKPAKVGEIVVTASRSKLIAEAIQEAQSVSVVRVEVDRAS
jgi:hypothetical protein